METWFSIITRLSLPKKKRDVVDFDLIPLTSFKESSIELTDLPPELQTKILSYLPWECMRKTRLVCSWWRDIIDTSREFSITVNDRRYDYSACEFPAWKITSFRIECFHHYPAHNFQTCLNTLRKLSICGTISKPNFHHLVNSADNIEELELAGDFFTSNKDFWMMEDGVCQMLRLERLKKVTIFSNLNILKLRANLLGLFNQRMPNLSKLKMMINDTSVNGNGLIVSPDEVDIAIELAKFVGRQRNLKFLQISISPFVLCDEDWTLETMQRNQGYSIYAASLAKLKLQICRLNASPLYFSLFRPLLSSQNCLKDFRIQSQFLDDIPIRYRDLETSVRCSVTSLVSIHLEWVSQFPIHPMTVVNFQLFAQAKHLKRLILKRWWGFSSRANGMAKISNLDKIPHSLQLLDIEGFLCSTADINMIAKSRQFKLTEIRLIKVGLFGEGVGIDGYASNALCSMEYLKTLCIGPLKNRNEVEEDIEYRHLRDRFKNDAFRSGEIVTIDFETFKRKQRLTKRKDTQKAEKERSRVFCSCL